MEVTQISTLQPPALRSKVQCFHHLSHRKKKMLTHLISSYQHQNHDNQTLEKYQPSFFNWFNHPYNNNNQPFQQKKKKKKEVCRCISAIISFHKHQHSDKLIMPHNKCYQPHNVFLYKMLSAIKCFLVLESMERKRRKGGGGVWLKRQTKERGRGRKVTLFLSLPFSILTPCNSPPPHPSSPCPPPPYFLFSVPPSPHLSISIAFALLFRLHSHT